ncbi:N2,N2-dimethylguanosine tRNA methyltransferase [Powellomyces hirtus]|nr:N2,N2-dimethylguanosine tRNA methyltransferase [Powellomyces hirtus]
MSPPTEVPETKDIPKWKSFGPDGVIYITEGKARIKFPAGNEVFYNPVQEFNRDMSIAAITAWSKIFLKEKVERSKNALGPKDSSLPPIVNGYVDSHKIISPDSLEDVDLDFAEYKEERFTILEALSATGLRAIRYAKDIKGIKSIIANDLLEDAVHAIKENVKANEVEETVVPNLGDANAVMYKAIESKFDVIDLDPYGSASPFLDNAVQSVSDGGLLCITCTDMAVLAGSQPDACWAKYGGMSIPNTAYCHEMGLRILLHAVQSSAARYKRCIEPLASLSIDFYVRIFVRVNTSPKLVKKAAGKSSLVYNCTGCRSFVTQPLGKSPQNGDGNKIGPVCGPAVGSACEHCNKRFHIGGPFYNGPIHNPEFVARMIKEVNTAPAGKYGTKARMLGMLTVVSEELPVPFYYECSALAATVRTNTPRLLEVVSALLNMNYKVSMTHAAVNCFKTNAPGWAIWDMMRKLVELHPVVLTNFAKDAPGQVILAKESKSEVSFEKHPLANPPSRQIKLVRYQENPTKNWGPMARAGKKADRKEGKESNKKEAKGRCVRHAMMATDPLAQPAFRSEKEAASRHRG